MTLNTSQGEALLDQATTLITDLLLEAPDLAIGLWYRLANDLYGAQPALLVEGDDLVCPYCKHKHLNGRHLRGRSWDTSFETVTLADRKLQIWPSDQGADFTSLYYECAGCDRGLRLPSIGAHIDSISIAY